MKNIFNSPKICWNIFCVLVIIGASLGTYFDDKAVFNVGGFLAIIFIWLLPNFIGTWSKTWKDKTN